MSVLPQPSACSASLVLRTWPCGESSVIASLLTRDHGYVKVIAKAARRPKSRLRALVEPGRLVTAEFSLDPRRELQYLRGGSVERDPMAPGVTLEQTAFLQAALELVDRCRPVSGLPEGQADISPAVDLFEICDAFIRMLSSRSGLRSDLAFFAFEWALLNRHGMAPEVAGCTSCGLDHDKLISSAMWFNPAEGGVICDICVRGDGVSGGRPLGVAALDIFRKMAAGQIDLSAETAFERPLRREIGAHLHHFLGYHLPGYRLPVALDLLRARKDRS